MITDETLNKNYSLIQKITYTMPKQLKIGKTFDNCFGDRDFLVNNGQFINIITRK